MLRARRSGAALPDRLREGGGVEEAEVVAGPALVHPAIPAAIAAVAGGADGLRSAA